MSIKTRLAGLGLSTALILAGGTLVAPWEGLRPTAYKDVVGIWTQCYGDTHSVDRNKPKTLDQCTDSLAIELIQHNQDMKKYVKVPMTDYQEAAFTSLVYNIGATNWKNSTALKLLNLGQYNEACQQLPRWNKADGKVFKGLTNRRLAEMEVCLGNNKQAIEEARRVFETYKSIDTSSGEGFEK